MGFLHSDVGVAVAIEILDGAAKRQTTEQRDVWGIRGAACGELAPRRLVLVVSAGKPRQGHYCSIPPCHSFRQKSFLKPSPTQSVNVPVATR